MADELEQELNQPSEAEKRIKQLSEKVKTTSEDRDEKDRLLGEQSAKTSEVERERDFFKGFADVVSTNPQAKDHQDDILAKVKSGYTVEDATYAVLGKAGKLGKPETVVETAVAGGSATNSLPQGEKKLDELSRDEKRAELDKILAIT